MNKLLNKCHACGKDNSHDLHSILSCEGKTGLKIVLLCDNCHNILQGILNRTDKEVI